MGGLCAGTAALPLLLRGIMGKVHSKPSGAVAQAAAQLAASQANGSAPPLERRTPAANEPPASPRFGARQVEAEPVRSRPLTQAERHKKAKTARELLATATKETKPEKKLATLQKAIRLWRELPASDVDTTQIADLTNAVVEAIGKMYIEHKLPDEEMLQLPFECAACLRGNERTELLASFVQTFAELPRARNKDGHYFVRPEIAKVVREALTQICQDAQNDPSQAEIAADSLLHLREMTAGWSPMALNILAAADFCASSANPESQAKLSEALKGKCRMQVSLLRESADRATKKELVDGYRNRLAALAHCLVHSGRDLAGFGFPESQEWFVERMNFLAGLPAPESETRQIAQVIFQVTPLPEALTNIVASYIREADLDAAIAEMDRQYKTH
jgi:hypothetical protein